MRSALTLLPEQIDVNLRPRHPIFDLRATRCRMRVGDAVACAVTEDMARAVVREANDLEPSFQMRESDHRLLIEQRIDQCTRITCAALRAISDPYSPG